MATMTTMPTLPILEWGMTMILASNAPRIVCIFLPHSFPIWYQIQSCKKNCEGKSLYLLLRPVSQLSFLALEKQC